MVADAPMADPVVSDDDAPTLEAAAAAWLAEAQTRSETWSPAEARLARAIARDTNEVFSMALVLPDEAARVPLAEARTFGKGHFPYAVRARRHHSGLHFHVVARVRLRLQFVLTSDARHGAASPEACFQRWRAAHSTCPTPRFVLELVDGDAVCGDDSPRIASADVPVATPDVLHTDRAAHQARLSLDAATGRIDHPTFFLNVTSCRPGYAPCGNDPRFRFRFRCVTPQAGIAESLSHPFFVLTSFKKARAVAETQT